jgi:hypothetical protein
MKEKEQATNSIGGITITEAKLLQSVLLFIRQVKPFETLEIKLNDNEVGNLSVMVKSNYKQVFRL